MVARADAPGRQHSAPRRVLAAVRGGGIARYPDTWLASDGAATAVWIPPGGTEMSPAQEERLAGLAAAQLGPGAANYLELVSRFEAAHPRAEPHYYLSLLGTHPDHRGQGIGMRLLAHGLAQIDAERLPAVVEPGQQPPVHQRRLRAARRVPVPGRRLGCDDHVAAGPLDPARRCRTRCLPGPGPGAGTAYSSHNMVRLRSAYERT